MLTLSLAFKRLSVFTVPHSHSLAQIFIDTLSIPVRPHNVKDLKKTWRAPDLHSDVARLLLITSREPLKVLTL